ncbi:MAG: DUF4837 family protein [Bacteroidia bacterium]
MLKKHTYFVLISALVFFQSCGDHSQVTLPVSVGKLGSLIVVGDLSIHNSLKSTVDSVFLKPLPHLPAGEPFFELLKPDAQDFQRFYYNQKSVFVLVDEGSLNAMENLLEPFSSETINDLINNKEPKLMSKRNLFARYQHIVYLFGKDAKDLQRKLRLCQAQLNNALMSYELEDQNLKLFKDTSANDKYFKVIKEELGLGVKIPDRFDLKYHKNNTFWFQYDAIENDVPKTIALVMHTYPYKDTSDFTYESIRTARDTVMKYLIKGEVPGTYMGTTESEFYPPIFQETINLNSMYCSKIRGWWTIRGLSMAGPFVRYVVHIPNTNTLFAFEGFVYKPNLNTKERDLRLIEAIALSIK